MERGANVALRAVRPPDEVMAERFDVIREDYIALVPEARIVATRAREWLISRRSVRRYLTIVKGRCRRDHATATEMQHERVEARILAGIARVEDTERLCREQGDLKALNAAQKNFFYGLDVYMDKAGLKAARKVEHTTAADAVAKMSPAERRERALRALKRQLEAMPTTGEPQ